MAGVTAVVALNVGGPNTNCKSLSEAGDTAGVSAPVVGSGDPVREVWCQRFRLDRRDVEREEQQTRMDCLLVGAVSLEEAVQAVEVMALAGGEAPPADPRADPPSLGAAVRA